MPVAKHQEPEFKRLAITPLHVKPKRANGGTDPSENLNTLYFSSIITEFTDSWTPRWSPTNVYGRMDPVSFYSGTGRELTLGFRVISDSTAEASDNMHKIQRLIQYQYPTYRSYGGVQLLAAPPYFSIQFMNIIGGGSKTLHGYINGAIQINPGFQSKEQAQYFSANNKNMYFSDVNIVLRMTVLHQKSPGFGATTSKFFGSNSYPYGAPPAAEPQASPTGVNTHAATAPAIAPAQIETQSGAAAAPPGAPAAVHQSAAKAQERKLSFDRQGAKMQDIVLSPADTGDDSPPPRHRPPRYGSGRRHRPDIGNTQVSDETSELQEAAWVRGEKRKAGRNAQEARNARLKAVCEADPNCNAD